MYADWHLHPTRKAAHEVRCTYPHLFWPGCCNCTESCDTIGTSATNCAAAHHKCLFSILQNYEYSLNYYLYQVGMWVCCMHTPQPQIVQKLTGLAQDSLPMLTSCPC